MHRGARIRKITKKKKRLILKRNRALLICVVLLPVGNGLRFGRGFADVGRFRFGFGDDFLNGYLGLLFGWFGFGRGVIYGFVYGFI